VFFSSTHKGLKQIICYNKVMKQKKLPLFILLILSFTISRFVFYLINDPEGPNLLIVTVLAMIIFVPTSLIYLKVSKSK
jgi:hypothetical protein